MTRINKEILLKRIKYLYETTFFEGTKSRSYICVEKCISEMNETIPRMKEYTVDELVKELGKRDGVEVKDVGINEKQCVATIGPAYVVVVKK